jgi:hypothetical protein
VGDPDESAAGDAVVWLEREVEEAKAARNGALFPWVEAARLDLAAVAPWLAMAAENLGVALSELDAEILLATAARDQGGKAAAGQVLLEDARRRLTEATAEVEFARKPASPAARPSEGAEKWRDLVVRYFPARIVEEAVNVMQCESEGDPTARNRRSGATGLFQFLAGTWRFAAEAAGVAHLPPTDPEANIAAAAWLVSDSEERGSRRWAHWTCRP